MSPGIPALIQSNRKSSQDMVCCVLGSLTKDTFRANNDVSPSQAHYVSHFC